MCDRFVRERRRSDRFGREVCQALLLFRCGGRIDTLVVGAAKILGKLAVMLARILAGASSDFSSEQVRYDAVLVGRPYRAVAPQKCRSRALFPAKADGAIGEPRDEPLESHGHFDQPAVQTRC